MPTKTAIEELFAHRLREVRKSLGLTQEQLAELASMTTQEISRFENLRRTPSLRLIERLAKALGVPVMELLRPLDTELPDDAALEALFTRIRGCSVEEQERVIAVVDALLRSRGRE